MKSRLIAIIAGIMLFVVLALQSPVVFAAPPVLNDQAVSIPENSSNATTTTPSQIVANDPDPGTGLTFLLTGGSGVSMFNVSPTGTITYNGTGSLDFESATKSYTLEVQVTDGQGGSSTSDTGTVTVNVTDVSDTTPEIENQNFNVPENSANNFVVGTVVVTDPENDAHTFTETGGTGMAVFNVDASTGQIRVQNSAALDFESGDGSYTLDVSVKDVGSNNSNSATMTITETNVNEPPAIADDAFSVSEDAPNNTVVGTVTGVDPEGLAVDYAIIGTTPFSINAATGEIKVANSSALDHEGNGEVDVTVRAFDPADNFSDATVTVTVTDANDAPQTSGIPNVVVNEGSSPTNINLHTFFSDAEDDDNAMTYTVESNSNPGLFSSVAIDGSDVLKLTYNANGAGESNIKIRATDTGGKFVESTFKVDINDAPTTSGIGDFSVNEDASNTTIDLYDVFNDAEEADSELTYAIVSNSNAGLVASSISAGRNLVLDYADNANGNSTIKVKATDSGGLFVETQFKVTVIPVNDNPTTTGLNDVQVAEDTEQSTIQLFPAFADIEDTDAELTYTITGNSDSSLFIGGTPSINQTQQSAALTLKYKPNTSGESTLTIRATDTGGKFIEASFKVTIGSAADKPVLTDFSKNTNEDTVLAFSKQDFESHFTDDDGEPLAKVRIVSLPNKGVLKRGNVTLQVNDEITANDLNSLTFMPEANWDTGNTSFEWNASDGNDYADKAAKVTITVVAVNDPPKVFNFNKIEDEDKTISFALTDFSSLGSYQDVENDPLASVRIGSLPANGSLKLGNSDVLANQVIGAGNLGTLKFVPNSNWSGSTSFEWNASDGQLFAATPALVNITINPKNDAPAIDLNGPSGGTGYTALFNSNAGPAVVGGPNMTLTDLDGDTLDAAYVKISQFPDGAAEILNANKSGTNINVSYNVSKHTLTLQGPDTIANFLKVLKTVTYDNTSTTPDSSDRSVRFEVYDGQTFSNTAIATVEIVRPAILLTIEKPFQTVISGETAIFTLTIANVGDVDLTDVTLESSVADCDKGLIKETFEAGETLPPIVCTATNVTQRIDNVLEVTAQDTTGGPPVTSELTAVVRVSNPNIFVEILADPSVGYTVAKGADVPLLVIVGNTSQARLKDVTLEPLLKAIVASGDGRSSEGAAVAMDVVCDFEMINLDGGEQREFNCTIHDVVAPIALEVSAVGTIDGTSTTVDDFDLAEINVLDIVIQATSDVFELPAGKATDVQFGITLTNSGSKPVTLIELTSRNESDQLLHGDLLDATNPLIKNSTCQITGDAPVIEADGGTFACNYTASVLGEIPEFTNRITFTVEDEDANTLSNSEDIVLSVVDDSGVRAILNAEPSTLIAPGGDIELLVQIRNNTGAAVSLVGLQGSQVGDLNGVGDCEVPQEIGSGESYLCSYSVTRTGLSSGDELTFVLTATVEEFDEPFIDDVVIRVTERGNKKVIFPAVPFGARVGEPNNDGCSAMAINPLMDNVFYADDQSDWYKIVLTSPATLEFELSNYQIAGQLNVFIAPDCKALSTEQGKFFSDGTGNAEQRVKIANAQPATYFIRVYGPDPEGGPVITTPVPYVLRVKTSTP